ncbi:hypothetical protein OTU49_012014, partial [Cherax quadricarinatus]
PPLHPEQLQNPPRLPPTLSLHPLQIQKCHDLGEERECQMAAGVMTSLYSQKLCSDLGYEDCATFHLNTVKETLLDLSTLNTTKFKIMTKYLSTKYRFTSKI